MIFKKNTNYMTNDIIKKKGIQHFLYIKEVLIRY